MEEFEQPRKKIKIDLEESVRPENGSVTQSSNVKSPAKGSASGASSHLQFNPSVIERLRKITKEAQKKFPNSKSEHSREAAAQNGDSRLVNGEASRAQQEPETENEFIASSAGSSPAHSPKLSDLTKLSTPPKFVKSFDSARFGQLLNTLEEAFPAKDNENESSFNPSSRCVNRNEGESKSLSNQSSEITPNGDVDNEPVVTVVEEKPTSGPTETTQTGQRRKSVDFNSVELREVIKKLLEEKMTQMVTAITEETQKCDLKERMDTLEIENRALHNYAARLESTVKQLVAKQGKKRDRVSRWAQTDPVVFNTSPPASSTASSSVKSSPGPSTGGSKVLNVCTGSTTRMTSTVAPLPGHSIPKAAETRTSTHNIRSIATAQVQGPGPRTAPPAGMAHRQQAAPNQRYPVPYQPPPQVQPPRSLPPRALPPTVTVRPQTQPPPNSPGAQAPFHRPPPPYGYPQSAAQTVYSNSQPTPTPTPLPQRQPSSSMVAAVPRVQAPPLQAPPRFQSPRPQGAHVQKHTPYVVRTSLAQHPPPAFSHQERGRMQSAANGVPALVAASIPPAVRPAVQSPRAVLPPPRPALPPGRIQTSPVAVRPSVTPVNPPTLRLRSPPAQQNMMVCSPVAENPQAANFIQAESQAIVPAASAPGGVQENGDAGGAGTESPPKPTVSIAVVMSGIVLSWNMSLDARHARIVSYQLFALQDGNTTTGVANQWKKIGVVKALPLPMACTLTQFLPGNKYHFAVRASDAIGRSGPFSEPCTITLK